MKSFGPDTKEPPFAVLEGEWRVVHEGPPRPSEIKRPLKWGVWKGRKTWEYVHSPLHTPEPLKRLLGRAQQATTLPYLERGPSPFFLRDTGEWRSRLPDPGACYALTTLTLSLRAALELRHIPQRDVIHPVYNRGGKWRFKAERLQLPNQAASNNRGGAKLRGAAEECAQYARPRTYADCLPGGVNAARPCPWVSCRSHLYLVMSKKGSVKPALPGKAVDALEMSCLNDVIAKHKDDITMEDIGQAVGLTHQRVSQILKKVLKNQELRELLQEATGE